MCSGTRHSHAIVIRYLRYSVAVMSAETTRPTDRQSLWLAPRETTIIDVVVRCLGTTGRQCVFDVSASFSALNWRLPESVSRSTNYTRQRQHCGSVCLLTYFAQATPTSRVAEQCARISAHLVEFTVAHTHISSTRVIIYTRAPQHRVNLTTQ